MTLHDVDVAVRCRPMVRLLKVALAASLLSPLACGGDKSTTATTPTSPTSPTTPTGMQVAPLRDAAQSAGKLVGAAVQSGLLADGQYSAVLSRHFNYLTAEYEMKWDAIERTRGASNFGAGDSIVAYGQSNGMKIKGHALIWHGSVPSWVGSLSAQDLRAAFEDHIRSVAEHFRGRVVAWDVVRSEERRVGKRW